MVLNIVVRSVEMTGLILDSNRWSRPNLASNSILQIQL